MAISRRGFIKTVSTTAVVTPLVGCPMPIMFNHGVASGDPMQDRVIIWTRISTLLQDVSGKWKVATDKKFKNVVRKGKFYTDGSRDFTVKVDVDGLDPNTRYYYQFKVKKHRSPIGQTKTLPAADINQASIAVVSCSNYPAGYFNVYREIVNQNRTKPLDAVLHLGDYIYEYGEGGYASEDAEALDREPSKGTECLTLDDYRKRYAQYRTDEDLMALHAEVPMIAVWDDHEIANDAWKNGAENHNEGEGDFAVRRAAAVAAWLEWLPVRENDVSSAIIYRQFQIGNLVDLYMLDTRIVGRDEPLSYTTLSNPSDPNEIAALIGQAASPERQLLGTDQKQWLQQSMAMSSAKWSVFGQQVLMAKMFIPSTVLLALFGVLGATEETRPAAVAAVNTAIQAYLADPSSDPTKLPYNLDAWDGYMADREWLYAVSQAFGKTVVSLAGDTHNGWNSELRDVNGQRVGVELATSSVSSPGLEEYLGLDAAGIAQFEGVMPLLIDELGWTDLSQRGFMRVDFTADDITSTWHFVSDIKSQTYTVSERAARSEDGVTMIGL